MVRKALLIVLVLLCGTLPALSEEKALRQFVDSLNQSLDRLESVQKERELMLTDLKTMRLNASSPSDRIAIGEKIGRAYLSSNLDSAVLYMRLAHSDANSAGLNNESLRMRMQLYSLLPSIGIAKEAVDKFTSIDYETLDPSLRRSYWLSATELYNSLQIPYPPGLYKDVYMKLTKQALDSLINYYPPESAIASYLAAHRHLFDNEENLAVANFAEVLPRLEGHRELRDVAMRHICDYYVDKPQHRQAYLTTLMRRALNNLNEGIVRPATLATIGEELINEGYGTIGRRCIRLALETADLSYTSPYTTFDRAHYAHFVTNEALTLRRATWLWIILLVIAVGAFVFITHRLRSKLKAAEARTDTLKAEYDSWMQNSLRTNQNLISLAFMSMEQNKDFSVHVMRKLKAGQVKDLFVDVESGKYIQQQKEKYFAEFDATFLSTFPNFIENLNKLIIPGKEITAPSAESLSPELRIAAFMKLGISDSARLSEALGLSINTIYTYRNRLRSRLADKDNFEENLLKMR